LANDITSARKKHSALLTSIGLILPLIVIQHFTYVKQQPGEAVSTYLLELCLLGECVVGEF